MPESERKLEEIYRLTRQNNKMLRGMRRAAFWGTVFKLVLYAALLGIPVYLYFTMFQPVIGSLMDAYAQMQAASAQMQHTGSQLQDITSTLPLEQIQGLLNAVPGVDFSGNSQ